MKTIESQISNFIETQFPSVYREYGPSFVSFTKAYYEWLESSNNVIYHSRRLLDYSDIDNTIEDFIVHYKNMYMNSIRFETAVDTPRIIKHSLDIYRSKGTERSVSLFFKSVFGVDAQVYYPSQDIFKTSDGKWIKPEYLELAYRNDLANFENIQIEGISSGATAFVEKFIKKKSGKNAAINSYLYYISDRIGNFQTGEILKNSTTGVLGPVIIGSATTLDVLNGGANYEIGDIVYLISDNNGIDGTARVANTRSITGKVTFNLVDGGWGYNANSEIIISNNILTVNNVIIGDPSSGTNLFDQFETLIQPLANIGFNTSTNGMFNIGDTVYRTDNTGSQYTNGTIISVSYTNSTAGSLLITYNANGYWGDTPALETESGSILETEDGFDLAYEDNISLDANNFIYNSTTGAYANIMLVKNQTASANIMKLSDTMTLYVSNSFIHFSNNDEIYQLYGNTEVANAKIISVSYSGTIATLSVNNYFGSFYSNTILGRTGNSTGYLDNILLNVGIYDVKNNFLTGDTIYSSNSNSTAVITKISNGLGAAFTLTNNFTETEDVKYNIDVVSDYYDTLVGASNYYLGNGVSNLSSYIGASLAYYTNTYGSISDIVITNDGNDYDAAPYVIVYEPSIAKFKKLDFILNITDLNGFFVSGEIVQDSSSNSNIGIVKPSSNSTVLFLKRICFEDIKTGTSVIGLTSNSTANITVVAPDTSTDPLGLNAVITSNAAIALGEVNELQVFNSGKNYFEGETVTFKPVDSLLSDRIMGTAEVHLGQQGTSDGFYIYNNSALSGTKYLQDSDYYQQFSYEIQSEISLDKYEDVLKSILHIAGTKHFSKYVFIDTTNIEPSTQDTTISITMN